MKGLSFPFSIAWLGLFLTLVPSGRAKAEDCPVPRIQEQSKNAVSVYQGDRILLRVKACGESLRYEWAFFDPQLKKSEYKGISCKAESCSIETGTLPEGSYEIQVAVSNAKGAAFTKLSFSILDRPAKTMAGRTIEPDFTAASQATQLDLSELHGKLHDNSAYSRGIHHMSQGETIAAKTQLTYSLWEEPQYRDKAETALNQIKRQERWNASFHFGLLQDSNFLRQGSSETAEGEEELPRARLAYLLAPSLNVKAYRSEQHETLFLVGMKREANFEFLKLYGLDAGGSNEMNAYDQTRFHVSLRQTYSSDSDWEKASLLFSAEPSIVQMQTATSASDRALGLKFDLGSPVLRGSPTLSVLLEKHQDADTSKATPSDPVSGEVHPWPDHSGQLLRLGLDLTIWRKHLSEIKGRWQQETWKHEASDAQAGDYNALRFAVTGKFRIGLKQALSTQLGYEGRLHPEASDARLDRKFTVAGSWSWYTYPYLYRSLTLLSENNQSDRSSAQYQRLILMISGSIEI